MWLLPAPSLEELEELDELEELEKLDSLEEEASSELLDSSLELDASEDELLFSLEELELELELELEDSEEILLSLDTLLTLPPLELPPQANSAVQETISAKSLNCLVIFIF